MYQHGQFKNEEQRVEKDQFSYTLALLLLYHLSRHVWIECECGYVIDYT